MKLCSSTITLRMAASFCVCLHIVFPPGITGNPNVGFVAADLDRDFDPASYDEAMARAFDDYYIMNEEEGEGEGGEGEGGKPVFLDDDGESIVE